MPDFDEFFDSVLLKLDTTKSGERAKMAIVNEACREVQSDLSPDWIRLTIQRLREMDYGKLVQHTGAPGRYSFAINAKGLSRAAVIRRQRQPLTFSDKLASEKFQKISVLFLSVLSLLVSLAALTVAYLAYQKA